MVLSHIPPWGNPFRQDTSHVACLYPAFERNPGPVSNGLSTMTREPEDMPTCPIPHPSTNRPQESSRLSSCPSSSAPAESLTFTW
jgi:hypothetical protein